ncbi:universal stress protein [Yoonia maritima]|uniref:universal stress protein n=1 Tax=Yoonia maritima TaxID=1435347 RepID=UPI001EF7C5A6|nr:universal stress protein [Yoonia maritima]
MKSIKGMPTMAYKIISVILTQKEDVDGLNAAIALATRMDAHLDIYAITISHSETGGYYMGAEAMLIADQTREAIKQRDALEKWVNAEMQGETVRWSLQGAAVQGPALSSFVARNLRFSDLVVTARPYQDSEEVAAIVEASLFAAERPVLMIPKGCTAPEPNGRVIVGWNDGTEAMTAIRAALPFLAEAAQTDICIIDPPVRAADRSDPGGAVAQYLMRHGAKTQVDVLAKTEPDIAEILLRHTREVGAQMIVSGAYGHSRLREAVFGGTTRSLLEMADRPILMSR